MDRERVRCCDMEADFDPNAHLLIVVGAHPRAERADRPLALQLVKRIGEWISGRTEHDRVSGIEPFVLTDLWYLNDESLRPRPVIAIGDPEFNACSAYFSNRLPETFVIDGSLRILLDLEFAELRACLWGSTPSATDAAVDHFASRYLEPFLIAASAGG